MEAKLGGPVWHASVAWHHPRFGVVSLQHLPREAMFALWGQGHRELDGVGDAALGEWREDGEQAIHFRRRVSLAEWGDQPWGMDYRATPECRKRLEPLRASVPAKYYDELLKECR